MNENVNISTELWKDILQDKEIATEPVIQILSFLFNSDGYGASGGEVAFALNYKHHAPLNRIIPDFSKRILKKYPFIDPLIEKSGAIKYWHIPFLGTNSDNGFIWILRPELATAFSVIYQNERGSQEIIPSHRCWWFGVNNINKRSSTSKNHVIYTELKSLLDGSQEEFEWRYHNKSKRFYETIQPNDKFLFWMGDGENPNWGIFGFGRVSRVTQNDDPALRRYFLKMDFIPPKPITPYPSKHPQETEFSRFLMDLFGLDFRPLGKTFSNLGYGTNRVIITIDEIEKEKYDALWMFALEHSSNHPNIFQEIEHFKESSKNLQETTREAVIQSRIGQGQFRTSLIGYWQGCSVSGCTQFEILKASHIKPWRFSTNEERLDVFNGLLLLPNLDTCFDSGFISFEDDGNIIISSRLSETSLLQLGINPDMKLMRVEEKHKDYLRFHREKIFRP